MARGYIARALPGKLILYINSAVIAGVAAILLGGAIVLVGRESSVERTFNQANTPSASDLKVRVEGVGTVAPTNAGEVLQGAEKVNQGGSASAKTQQNNSNALDQLQPAAGRGN